MSKNKYLFKTILFAFIFAILFLLLRIFLIVYESQLPRSAFRSSFETEIKTLVKGAPQQWMMDTLDVNEATEKIYSSCENSCFNNIESIDSRSSLHYYIYVGEFGEVKKIYVTDGEFQYYKVGDDIKSDDIVENDKQVIKDLNKNEIITIKDSKVYLGDNIIEF